MSRSLRHFLPLEVDPAAATATFTGEVERWLPGARHVGPGRYTIEVGTDALERPVTVTVGDPWHVGSTWWRTCSWEPATDRADGSPVTRLLPSLDAELGLAVRDGRATLLLDGRYDPPGGRLGDAVEAVALGRVARVTVERLLADIASKLGSARLVGHDQP
jgi:hypothetical protein